MHPPSLRLRGSRTQYQQHQQHQQYHQAHIHSANYSPLAFSPLGQPTPSLENDFSQRLLPQSLLVGSPFFQNGPHLKHNHHLSDNQDYIYRGVKILNFQSKPLIELLKDFKFGPLESAKLQNDGSVVLSFVDSFIACHYYNHALKAHNVELIALPPVNEKIQLEINENGASRALCLTNICISKESLQNLLEKFGIVVEFNFIDSENAAFVKFTSIINAMKCKNQFHLLAKIDDEDKGDLSQIELEYGNDEMLDSSINDQFEIDANNLSFSNLNSNSNSNSNYDINSRSNSIVYDSRRASVDFTPPMSNDHYVYYPPPAISAIPPPAAHSSSTSSLQLSSALSHHLSHPIVDVPSNIGNRTVYLGNLSNNLSIEEICNVIRGGNLENIKYLPHKKIAFITFIRHIDAANFIARANVDHVFLNSKYVKVGWGHNSGYLSPEIEIEINENNATRNLYIGVNENTEREGVDFLWKDGVKLYNTIPKEETLRRDFSIFGQIEQVNYFKNGACAFINFTDIRYSIKAVHDLNNNVNDLHQSLENRYEKLLISYGKDRCGNPPKKKRRRKKTLGLGVITNSSSSSLSLSSLPPSSPSLVPTTPSFNSNDNNYVDNNENIGSNHVNNSNNNDNTKNDNKGSERHYSHTQTPMVPYYEPYYYVPQYYYTPPSPYMYSGSNMGRSKNNLSKGKK
ncbi:hypothetical protein JL09_g246 [Pichia kudriavzevii]|uniref:RRM domain-containing protein n=1 Tax=Pichia kudriavzevii TaxID=4909 RepID=A0A099P6H9_PICKU|nr:hypothetical protein JL09_g246 [Pichia kudriavzevii]